MRVGASPFPIIKGQLMGGDTESPKTLSINQGLHFQDENGSFEWAEMAGSNYDMIQREIEYLEKQMQRQSVEFITDLKNATATEVEKSSTSKESKLADYAQELEDGINDALMMIQWFTTDKIGDNYITVNKDFDSAIMKPEQAQFLLSLFTQNALSYDMFIDLLIKGELLPYIDDKQKETEKLRLRDGGFED